jgi:hypothetical protein
VEQNTTGGVYSPPSHFRRTNLYQKVDMTFGACVAYLVDVMHSRSSEVLATMEFVVFIHYLEFNN